jgi:hypothetical protein
VQVVLHDYIDVYLLIDDGVMLWFFMFTLNVYVVHVHSCFCCFVLTLDFELRLTWLAK